MNTESSLLLLNEISVDIKFLDKNQYILSLLREGVKKGIITKEEVLVTEVRIMDLLKELILKFTKGDSTSVTIDTAQSLLNSLLYALDFYLLGRETPQVALHELTQRDIRDIYEDGLELLRLCVIDTKRLYGKIKRDRLKLELDAYNTTIDEGISSFFEKYAVVFEAHYAIASIDYPLVFDDMSIRGISYIKNYLEHWDIENQFCRFYEEAEIRKIIIGFEKMCRLTHQIELINVFEILINNAIFSVLCGNSAWNLEVTKDQFAKLKEKLMCISMSSKEIELLLGRAVDRVLEELKIENVLLIDYINAYICLFVKRVINAIKYDSLNCLVVVEEEYKEDREIVIAFDEGKKMSEKKFKLIIERIMKSPGVMDKIEIINSNVNALQDFVDILNGDCLWGEEFHSLFQTLGDIELTILVKVVFYEGIREGLIELNELVESKGETESDWQDYFISFIANLSDNRKAKIEGLLNQVDYEEIKFF